MTTHKFLGGKVNVYKRGRSRYWQCSSYVAGSNRRTSTQEESLAKAKDFAEDWYLELCAKKRYGDFTQHKTFVDAAKKFEHEYEAITLGQRSPKWVQGHKDRLRLHILPYFGSMELSSISSRLSPCMSVILSSDRNQTVASPNTRDRS